MPAENAAPIAIAAIQNSLWPTLISFRGLLLVANGSCREDQNDAGLCSVRKPAPPSLPCAISVPNLMTDRGFWVAGLRSWPQCTAIDVSIADMARCAARRGAPPGCGARRRGSASAWRMRWSTVCGEMLSSAAISLDERCWSTRRRQSSWPERQPREPLLDRFVGRLAAWLPIAVRQAVPILPSNSHPAQHSATLRAPSPEATLCHPEPMRQISADLRHF